ncbi:MAG: hypothetical protein U0798_04935 [Gemmataceae bacterium]
MPGNAQPFPQRGEPKLLPSNLLPPKSTEKPSSFSEKKPTVGRDGLPIPKIDQPLVRAENVKMLGAIDVRYLNNNWQVLAGPTVFANFGTDWKSAEKVGMTLQAMQAGDHGKATRAEMQMTSWATIGDTRPQIGYMTVRGEAVRTFRGVSNTSLPIDLNTLRAEEVRGVWVMRDLNNILLNFGNEKQEAEQAVAVANRYGFNRIGYIGGTDQPTLRYFFADADAKVVQNASLGKTSPAVAAAFQEANLDRAGVEIPGFGTVGIKLNLDFKKLDIRRESGECSLVHGGEVLARFGRDEWTARDALRVVKQIEPTALVRIGSPGIQFFLKGTESPNRSPFGVMGTAYSFDRITQRTTADGVIHLHDGKGREFTSVKTQRDADAIQAAIKHYNLSRSCQVGNGTHSLSFFVRTN